MAAIVKQVDERQDIYILGEYFNDPIDQAYGITDDYAAAEIRCGKEERFVDTAGFVYILTKDELLHALPYIDKNYQEDDGEQKNSNFSKYLFQQDGIILHNFKGSLMLCLFAQEDYPEMRIQKGDDLLKGNYNPQEYAAYEYDERFYNGHNGCVVDTELFLIVPEGTEMSKELSTQQLIEHAQGKRE